MVKNGSIILCEVRSPLSVFQNPASIPLTSWLNELIRQRFENRTHIWESPLRQRRSRLVVNLIWKKRDHFCVLFYLGYKKEQIELCFYRQVLQIMYDSFSESSAPKAKNILFTYM